MNYWMGLVSLVGILSTAVVFGTDMFFLTIGRPALRTASTSAGGEMSLFGNNCSPIVPQKRTIRTASAFSSPVD